MSSVAPRAVRLYGWPNVWRGMLIYGAGDTAAALILGEFRLLRMMGIMLVGGFVYAFEVPAWFRWIDRVAPERRGAATTLKRTGLAMLYFNPLWIARHIAFIRLFSGQVDQIGWRLLHTGTTSFAVNVPISLAGNFLIQNAIPARWRFAASATFSALMAVYYALSARWFR